MASIIPYAPSPPSTEDPSRTGPFAFPPEMPGGTAGLCRDGAAGAGRGGAAALGQRRGGERSARGSGAAVPCPVSAGGAGRGQAGRQGDRQGCSARLLPQPAGHWRWEGSLKHQLQAVLSTCSASGAGQGKAAWNCSSDRGQLGSGDRHSKCGVLPPLRSII